MCYFGYDVWVLSERGSVHSRSNERLSPLQRDFWRFTYNQVAMIDLPAFIDYVLAATGRPRLATISWSSAGCVNAMLYAGKPEEYGSKRVCAHIALAPVTFPQRFMGPLLVALTAVRADEIVIALDAALLVPTVSQLLGTICAQQMLPEILLGGTGEIGSRGELIFDVAAGVPCQTALYMAVGRPHVATSKDLAERITTFTWPSTLAGELLAQWAQMIREGPHKPVLQYFDYGTICNKPLRPKQLCNQEVYGTRQVPRYDLSKINVPTTLIVGGRGIAAVEWDWRNVAKIMTPGMVRNITFLPEYGHLDFAWYDAKAFFDTVLQALRSDCQ